MNNKHQLERITEQDWSLATSKYDSVFFKKTWQRLLEKSFGVELIYLFDNFKKDGTIIQVFKKGPFRLGYIAFPIGGTIKGNPISSLGISRIKKILKKDVQLLKINASGFRLPEEIQDTSCSLPETAILHLTEYDALLIAKVRRDINRSKRFGVNISKECKQSDALKMYQLYKQTIKRNKGIEKYNLIYFKQLILASRSNPNILVLTAKINEEYAGFLVLINEASMAYYLHGSVDDTYRSKGIADLLIYEATELAKSLGVTFFNMMTSPIQQKSLVKYKEKWGAETRTHRTHEIPINILWSKAFNLATTCHSYYHKKY